MPEADLAAARERRAQLARGWPDHLDWTPDPAVADELEALCAARRAACDYEWDAVTTPAPAAVADTLTALTAGLVGAGLPARLAEWAADFTRLLDWMSVVEVVRWTAMPKPEGWLRLLPVPLNAEISPPPQP